VAGKTFRGVGADEAPALDGLDDDRPRLIDEDDSRGLHSGPTVVDDQKVAEVLKKLRALDVPPGPLTGVTEVVLDSSSSEPTRLDSGDIVLDSGPSPRFDPNQAETGPARIDALTQSLMRPTSIGRSASTPVVEQAVTIPADLARGTLFGRSIHVPDVNTPDEAEIELSSGRVDFLAGAPPPSQPFPLADRPAVVVPPPTSAPARRFHTPYDADPHTQLVDAPRSKTLKRVVAFVGGIGLAAAGLLAWWQYGGGGQASSTPAAVTPVATPTAPTVSPLPPVEAPAGERAPGPAPAAAAAPITAKAPDEAPQPAPADTKTTPAAATDTTPAAAVPGADHAPAPVAAAATRHGSAHSHARHAPPPERRAAAKSAAPTDSSPESAKPAAPKRKLDEDPDATMAPSL
jgi:hypothetical protein